jgi:hypothetical protein
VTLGYDPQQWFKDPHRFENIGEYDYCYRYGKMYFVYDSSSLPAFFALQQSSPRGPIFLIVRPGEFHLGRPIHRIVDPEGEDALLIYEL